MISSNTRLPLPVKPGHCEREDYEYARCGVCNIFMAVEPLAGKRLVRVSERKTKKDWAKFLNEIAKNYEYAEKITLVMDNLNTHTPGSLYETFIPAQVKRFWNDLSLFIRQSMEVGLIWQRLSSTSLSGNVSRIELGT